MSFIVQPTAQTPNNFRFTVTQDREKQQIFTTEKMRDGNVSEIT